MHSVNWPALASVVAEQLRVRRPEVRRGSLPVLLGESTDEVVAAFCTEDGGPGTRGHQTLRLLRHALDEAGLQELGFGTTEDGVSWALLVRSEHPGGVRLLTTFLEEAVWEAWRLAEWDSQAGR